MSAGSPPSPRASGTSRSGDGPDAERFDRIHAFPSVTNQPSNALCRRFGFELMEETDFLYRGAQLRVNVWEPALG
ncbi:MAG TPA: hypothetical protein VI035_01290 [Solirubrobacterales bacterium]